MGRPRRGARIWLVPIIDARGGAGRSPPGSYGSLREVRHALLTDLIGEVHLAPRVTYGYRRVHAELTPGCGLVIAHGTVELLRRTDSHAPTALSTSSKVAGRGNRSRGTSVG